VVKTAPGGTFLTLERSSPGWLWLAGETVTFIAGLLIGAFVGFALALAFCWKLCVEGGKKIEAGDARYEAGTEEYRKALRALEIGRDERDAFRKKWVGIWDKLLEVCRQHHPEMMPDLESAIKENKNEARNPA
jgi:gas vesicle protein